VVHRAVSLKQARQMPISGSLVNLSETGAAICFVLHKRHGLEQWPAHLANGDEMWISDLLDDPVA
jgi:hypothetical protein